MIYMGNHDVLIKFCHVLRKNVDPKVWILTVSGVV